MAKFLDFQGLTTFFTKLKEIFASIAEVTAIEEDTDTYVLSIDYDNTLAFDTTEIITDNTTESEEDA